MSDAATSVPSRIVLVRDAMKIGSRTVNKALRVVTLVDRRTSAPPAAPCEWLFQADIEDLLYPSVLTMGTAGALYRLLKRAGAGGMSVVEML